ncbi:MAG: response regulator transcription factor [Gaiellaceae bacterium]
MTSVVLRPRVLVVDDDAAVRGVLSNVLADEGFEVVGAAADGAEAVELARSLRPDTILLDVRMPGVDGIEAARRIRALDPGVRLVMLSAYDDPTLLREAADAGASRFLVKGCPLPDLVEAVAG